MFKPDWFFDVGTFEFDTIETKRLLDLNRRNRIDCSDRSSESSEGTIANHTHSTTCCKYTGIHGDLNAPLASPLGESCIHLFQSTPEEACPNHTRKATKERFLFSQKRYPIRGIILLYRFSNQER